MIDRSEVDNSKNEQLCWNCKRSTNPEGLRCPWADKGEPVEGWTAAQGRACYKYDTYGNKVGEFGFSYDIMVCPLFVKDKIFDDYAKAIPIIANELGISIASIKGPKRQAYFDEYEKKTGVKVPYFVRYHNKEFGAY